MSQILNFIKQKWFFLGTYNLKARGMVLKGVIVSMVLPQLISFQVWRLFQSKFFQT
jgi:hypothetical protein